MIRAADAGKKPGFFGKSLRKQDLTFNMVIE